MSDSLTDEGITEAAFKAACGRYATGVSVVTTTGPDGSPAGLTVNSFTSVSLDPPLVLFCLDRAAGSFVDFEGADRFAVNVLSESQREISNLFATPGIANRFEHVAHRIDGGGLPLLDHVLARLVCGIENRYAGGDHVIIVGRVERIDMGGTDGKPLVYYRGGYGGFSG